MTPEERKALKLPEPKSGHCATCGITREAHNMRHPFVPWKPGQ